MEQKKNSGLRRKSRVGQMEKQYRRLGLTSSEIGKKVEIWHSLARGSASMERIEGKKAS